MGGLDTKALVIALARAAAITQLTLKTSRYIPRRVKWFVLFLVALNIRGFPLVWHTRVIVPWFAGILKQKVVKRTGGRDMHLKRLTSISPVGINPLDAVETWKSRAGIADCDYNGHLSNSSYAKNIDYCRLNAAVRFFPPFIGIGGTLPIAGTHHLFLKEIPLNAEYEIHLYLSGWEEQKWIYLTLAFITRDDPKRKKDNHGHKSKGVGEKAEAAAKELLQGVPDAGTAAIMKSVKDVDPSASVVIVPPVAEVANGATNTHAATLTPRSGVLTPSPAPQSGNATPFSSAQPSLSEERIKAALKAIRIPKGSTLHAVAVSQYCYKLGRVTVPPRVALTACGFGDPKRWEHIVKIRDAPDGERTMRQILRGGWRDREVWGDFWDFQECEEAGRKAGDALMHLRLVMEALGGDAKSAA